MNVVLLGPPGAGKGTLAGALKELWDLTHISTGDILREEMKNNSPLGQEIKKLVEDGQLVPDETVTKLIELRVSGNKKIHNGFMFDGFPRTTTQAQDLDKIVEAAGQKIDYAFFMEASLKTIVDRLTGRRVCRQCGALYHVNHRPSREEGKCDVCGGELYQRADDNEETIKKRMDVYLENTKPIIEYYKGQGKLKKLDANQESEDIQKHLLKTFNEDGKVNQNQDTR